MSKVSLLMQRLKKRVMKRIQNIWNENIKVKVKNYSLKHVQICDCVLTAIQCQKM